MMGWKGIFKQYYIYGVIILMVIQAIFILLLLFKLKKRNNIKDELVPISAILNITQSILESNVENLIETEKRNSKSIKNYEYRLYNLLEEKIKIQKISSNTTQVNEESLDVKIKSNKVFSILVAADEVVTNFLVEEGYSVKSIINGQEICNLLEEGYSFDLLIIDIMIPELMGFEVLRTIRKKYSYLEFPVIVLTNGKFDKFIELSFKMGANDFVKIPFKSSELRARVRTLVQLKSLVNDKVNAELMFLQAQIKPHFIFNALNVISSLIIKKPEQAKNILLHFSDYLRGSFEFDNYKALTTLKREIQLVRAYIAIEQERLQERLKVELNIQENIDCTLPILSIQPLVENAVRHGIMPLIEGGMVKVSICIQGEFLKVSISDNGVGIDIKKVENILHGEMKTRSVGIRNIHKRLIMLYGTGIQIKSGAEKGTIVEFQIPYK